jgi:hypothetical protein
MDRRWRPVISPALAFEHEATIVTYTKDFEGAERFGIRVIKPKELWTLIGGKG